MLPDGEDETVSALKALAARARDTSPAVVIIRAHGVTRRLSELLASLHAENPCFSFLDCTVPVSHVHQIVSENSSPE